MRGRKNNCPTSIKDWQVSIWNPFDLAWVRIRGLNSLNYSQDSSTEDGSTAEDDWEEPYITKRKAKLSLEGKPVVDAGTGEVDPGQDLLNEFGKMTRCAADALIRFADPYGHTLEAYYQVTAHERSTSKEGDKISWDLDMVGESESLPYVQVSGISIVSLGEEPETIEMDINDAPRLLQVVFNPENASNKRYSIKTGGHVVRVGDITDGGFTIAPLKVGEATVKVTSINNAETASVTVNVTNESQPYMSGVLGVGVLGSMVLGRSAVSAA